MLQKTSQGKWVLRRDLKEWRGDIMQVLWEDVPNMKGSKRERLESFEGAGRTLMDRMYCHRRRENGVRTNL